MRKAATPSLEELEQDAAKEATADQLSTIRALAERGEQLTKEVTEAEEALKAKKEALRELCETTLPGTMKEAGMRSFTLLDGTVINVKPVVAAAIPAAQLSAALAHLRANDNDGLIKTTVTVPFGKGESDEAEKLARSLAARGIKYDLKEGVHAQTLTAWVKERMAADYQFTEQERVLFGIYTADKAVFTLPKE